jgi:hypothetical protein
MIKPPLYNIKLPFMKSIINNTPVDPVKWIEEIEKLAYPYNEIIELIEYYEFIISCLIKSVSFLEIDKLLLEKVNNIFYRNYKIFAGKYFKRFEFYDSILFIIQFFNVRHEYFKYGLYETKYDTEKLYKYWNFYFNLIFNNGENSILISNLIKEMHKKEKIVYFKELISISRSIKVPEIDHIGINNLLDFFERKKEIYKQILNNQVTPNMIDDNDPEIVIEVGALLNYFISGLNFIAMETKETHYQTVQLSTELDNNTQYLENKITEDGEKTRELIISEALKITNEIQECYSKIPEKYRRECAEKLWMIARHPEFIKPMEILINKGYIKSENKHYKFVYEAKRGFGFNILAYCIFQYADLSKWADNSRSKNKLNDEYKGFFSKRVYEPFSVAFDIKNLENHIRDDKIPEEYNEFIKNSGLETCVNYAKLSNIE